MHDWLQTLLAHYGYGIIFLVIFLYSVGIPVPGTTLLVGAGFFVGNGTLSLWVTLLTAATACFLGSDCGYWIGLRYGSALLKKIRWLHLTPKRIKSTEVFFKKYGAKGVFLARFIGLIRPWTGFLAGVWKTPWRPFLFYNLAGSAVFACLYTLAGNFLGKGWALLKAWVGQPTFYAALLGVVLLVVIFYFRGPLYAFFIRAFLKKRQSSIRDKRGPRMPMSGKRGK